MELSSEKNLIKKKFERGKEISGEDFYSFFSQLPEEIRSNLKNLPPEILNMILGKIELGPKEEKGRNQFVEMIEDSSRRIKNNYSLWDEKEIKGMNSEEKKINFSRTLQVFLFNLAKKWPDSIVTKERSEISGGVWEYLAEKEKKESKKPEETMVEIMDNIWNSRFKESKDIKIQRADYYENLTKQKEQFIKNIEDYKAEYKKYESTLRSRREKREHLLYGKRRELNEKYLLKIKEFLTAIDFSNYAPLEYFFDESKNYSMALRYYNLIFNKKDKEEMVWQKSLAIFTKYIDSLEFSSGILDACQNQRGYNLPKGWETISEKGGIRKWVINPALMLKISTAINDWYLKHENEDAIIQGGPGSNRIGLLVEHFTNLRDSYLSILKRPETDSEKENSKKATENLMSITLSKLKKLSS